MSGLARTLVAILMMVVGPPLLLLLWAHLLRPFGQGSEVIGQGSELLALLVAGLFGVAGVLVAPWSERVRAVVAALYLLIAFVALPFLLLTAVCSTGDCL